LKLFTVIVENRFEKPQAQVKTFRLP